MRRLRIGAIVLLATACAASPVAARIAAACPMDHAQACCCGDAGAKDAACELRCANSTAVPESQTALTLPTGTPLFHLDTTAPARSGALDETRDASRLWGLAAFHERPPLKRYLLNRAFRL